ncbi:MAG: 3'(2'),5'-bisphosphate nucleotidase [Winogradskyella sp.]|uniref:3'(2'),5'-bisphosphate nucleotidase CysQ n=1 Tax=Winogradskyella sp. TaxID=1883156 RepID=UPI000F3C3290|nr:3'(2'),5'-bisphosphate nucleotidase CysQ [Winogradskyella sp.]RNC88172.1 MAG: 3'(2'),5'-bisphosphate nucleotidase [Winogradskyella sp.]
MEDLKSIAIIAALEAGKEIMEVYNSEIKIELKEDQSPLTEADRRANDVINRFLIDTKYPIISEENKQVEYTQRKQWDNYWVVDPLDGTKEFIKRNGEFTVNIAFVKNRKPVLGVIFAPFLEMLYVGDVEEKIAFKTSIKSEDLSINKILEQITLLKPTKRFDKSIKIVGSRSHMNRETSDFIESLNQNGYSTSIVSKGSSLKFCLVAEGSADVYPRFAPTMEWDTAAGQAICNAVGIDVISQETKQSLNYNKQNLLNPWFLVSNI